MNSAELNKRREENVSVMNTLSNIRCGMNFEDAVGVYGGCTSYLHANDDTRHVPSSINSGIDAMYMQNKLMDYIEKLTHADCFQTDNKGVISLLESCVYGSPTWLDR